MGGFAVFGDVVHGFLIDQIQVAPLFHRKGRKLTDRYFILKNKDDVMGDKQFKPHGFHFFDELFGGVVVGVQGPDGISDGMNSLFRIVFHLAQYGFKLRLLVVHFLLNNFGRGGDAREGSAYFVVQVAGDFITNL